MEIISIYAPYVYIALGLIVLIALINLFIRLSKLSKNINSTLTKVTSIKDKTDNINKATEKIEYTTKHSLPLFVGIISVYTVIKMIIKDYKKTDRNKRSIVNSSLNTAIRKPMAVSKAFSSFKNF